MTTLAPTFSQIRAQVAEIRRKVPEVGAIAIHTTGQWTGNREIRDGESNYLIEQCDSPLAMRMALRREHPEGAIIVLLTCLDEREIAEDIRIRLTKRKLFQIKEWQVIQSLFQAHAIDPRLTRQAWMAEQLLVLASQYECPAAPGGFLDLETVWAFLLDRGLGMNMARPDLPAVLRWSLDEDNVLRYKAFPEEFRKACAAWLQETAHPAVAPVLACVQFTQRPDALPVGLAAQVVFHPQASGKLDKAMVRLEERYFGSSTLDRDLCCRWGDAAREVIRLQITDEKSRELILKRADAILKEIGADTHAWLSDVSLVGFDQRLGAFGDELKRSLTDQEMLRLEQCRDAVFAHDQARREPRRLERVDMAVRLVRWLQENKQKGRTTPSSFAEAIQQYSTEGSFVDWARLTLRNGDPVASLADAYSMLFIACQTLQEQRAKVFAKLLQDWTGAGSKGEKPVPVEKILSHVVAPLAKKRPILIILMDGMSAAVFNPLVEEITKREWMLLRETNETDATVGLATIPSVTEYSRASLLCGKLTSGNATEERAGFSQHPDLVATCQAGKPPTLFHKADLLGSEEGGQLTEIRSLIASADHRILGVVINAIDDHLLKGGQIDIRWSPEEIRSLSALLYESKLANRIVVLLSDHGHILEFATSFSTAEGGDRWRAADRPSGENEIQLSGHRVFQANRTVITPWSESIRYGIKKNGYHGGANPQEMVVPIAILTAAEELPEGWVEHLFRFPSWWSREELQQAAATEPIKRSAKLPRKEPETLFDLIEEEDESTGKAPEMPKWINNLLVSSIFEEQKKLAGRAFPKNEKLFAELLRFLENNGGKMTTTALSRSLNYPALRLAGLLAVCQRVLNLDGYEVLGRDEDSDSVELNSNLLRRQFGIE